MVVCEQWYSRIGHGVWQRPGPFSGIVILERSYCGGFGEKFLDDFRLPELLVALVSVCDLEVDLIGTGGSWNGLGVGLHCFRTVAPGNALIR